MSENLLKMFSRIDSLTDRESDLVNFDGLGGIDLGGFLINKNQTIELTFKIIHNARDLQMKQ